MISIIVAVAQNGVIGGDNKLLWHISEDLKRFKAITSGHAVIMGRKTFESLGRPLPNRRNIVISRNEAYRPEGVEVVGSLDAAAELCADDGEAFVIGGGQIYAQAMDIADRLYVTWVGHDYEGDTHFPEIDPAEWVLTSEEAHERGEKFPYPFVYADYRRRG